MANPSADFPGSLHTNTDVSAFTGSNLGDTTPKHTDLEGKQEEELLEAQRKLGIGSTLVAPVDNYLIGSPAGTTSWRPLDISHDATPTLGGDLNGADKDITSGATITFRQEVAAGDISGTATINWNTGQKQVASLTGSAATLTLTAPPGPGNLLLRLINTGSPVAHPVVWPATVLWPGGTAPTLTFGSPTVDIVTFFWNGTNYYGVGNADFQ